MRLKGCFSNRYSIFVHDFWSLQVTFAIPLNNHDIFDMILCKAGPLVAVDVLEGGKGTLHVTSDQRGISHHGCGISVTPLKGLLWTSKHLCDLLHFVEAWIFVQDLVKLCSEGLQRELVLQVLHQLHGPHQRQPFLESCDSVDKLAKVPSNNGLPGWPNQPRSSVKCEVRSDRFFRPAT